MSLPECIFDSERIGQVLNNLIENAIKATPPGGMITLRSELYQNEVWIRVYDTGVGIPKDEQDKIFSASTARIIAPRARATILAWA